MEVRRTSNYALVGIRIAGNVWKLRLEVGIVKFLHFLPDTDIL